MSKYLNELTPHLIEHKIDSDIKIFPLVKSDLSDYKVQNVNIINNNGLELPQDSKTSLQQNHFESNELENIQNQIPLFVYRPDQIRLEILSNLDISRLDDPNYYTIIINTLKIINESKEGPQYKVIERLKTILKESQLM